MGLGASGYLVTGSVAPSTEAALFRMCAEGKAELSEASFEVFIQEGIKDWIQAAIGVSQGNAEMPARHNIGIPLVNFHHGPHNHKDVNGCPTNDEGGHHN